MVNNSTKYPKRKDLLIVHNQILSNFAANQICYSSSEVEQNFASELQRREERAAVAYELDKEKHILRHMQGRRFDSQNPGAFKSTMNPDNPVLIEGNWQEPTSLEQEKHDVVSQLQVFIEFDTEIFIFIMEIWTILLKVFLPVILVHYICFSEPFS